MECKELKAIAQSGDWDKIDISKLTLEIVNEPNYEGVNLFHIAAINGALGKFPKHLLNLKGLLIENPMEETVLHLAAGQSEIDVIPKEFLTIENMTKPNIEGNTPLHYTALKGGLQHLPKSLHTSEQLSIENEHGRTPLDFAVFGLVGYGSKEIKDKKEERNIKDNIRIILTNLSFKSLEHLSQKNHINIYDNHTKQFLQKEIAKRKLMLTLCEKESYIEI